MLDDLESYGTEALESCNHGNFLNLLPAELLGFYYLVLDDMVH